MTPVHYVDVEARTRFVCLRDGSGNPYSMVFSMV